VTQPIEAKRAALVSVLPLLHAHLHLICSLKSGLGQLAPTPPEGPPRPPEVVCPYDCRPCPSLGNGHGCPPDEAWVRLSRSLTARYRLYAVARSLDALEDHNRMWAHAVYWQHVEPWNNWNPQRRPGWAAAGVTWMADEIPGELVGYELGAPPKNPMSTKTGDIRRLRIAGLTYRAIAKELGCSKATVRAALVGGEVRRGRVKSADGA